jgi:hypothetical protein
MPDALLMNEDDDTLPDETYIMVPVKPSFSRRMTLEQRGQVQIRARQFIQSKYDEGVPFFSKDIFRDVAEQLDRCLDSSNPEHRVSLTALDGTLVSFLIEVGRVEPSSVRGYRQIR